MYENKVESTVGQSHETHCTLTATGQEKGSGGWDVNTVKEYERKVKDGKGLEPVPLHEAQTQDCVPTEKWKLRWQLK